MMHEKVTFESPTCACRDCSAWRADPRTPGLWPWPKPHTPTHRNPHAPTPSDIPCHCSRLCMGGSPSSTQRAPGDSERAAMQRSDKDVQRASTRRSGAPRSPISTRPRPSPTARVASSYSSGGGRTAALQREAHGGAATAAKAPSAGAAVTAEAGAGAGVGEAGSVSRRTEADEAKQFDEAVRAQDSVKLTVRGGSMQGNKGTKWLLQDIGGSARLRSMASRFYEKAFRDAVLYVPRCLVCLPAPLTGGVDGCCHGCHYPPGTNLSSRTLILTGNG